jgi:hypothetical protein
MKTYELNAEEIELVVDALHYVKLRAYGGELRDGEVDEYYALCALIDRLNPKPVKKEGWVALFDEGSDCMPAMYGVYASEKDARIITGLSRIVKVTWEE